MKHCWSHRMLRCIADTLKKHQEYKWAARLGLYIVYQIFHVYADLIMLQMLMPCTHPNHNSLWPCATPISVLSNATCFVEVSFEWPQCFIHLFVFIFHIKSDGRICLFEDTLQQEEHQKGIDCKNHKVTQTLQLINQTKTWRTQTLRWKWQNQNGRLYFFYCQHCSGSRPVPV